MAAGKECTRNKDTLYLQGVQAQKNKISKMFSSYRPRLRHVATQPVQSMRPRFTDFLSTFEHISPDVDQLSFEICARLLHHIKAKWICLNHVFDVNPLSFQIVREIKV